ncbi:hypothetical protein GQ457_15G028720 [Hibiscus cannabinus]
MDVEVCWNSSFLKADSMALGPTKSPTGPNIRIAHVVRLHPNLNWIEFAPLTLDQVRQNGKRQHDDKQQQSPALLKGQYIQRRLWHLFARHGEVCRAFIARKLSRGGKRFGFVRFSTEEDAKRAMERLDGFTVYGFRLTVKPETQIGTRESSNWTRAEAWRSTQRIKVRGHVVVEELWKLQRCLVGEMSTICSVGAVAMRLEKWGLNGIKVHKMGGKAFLLSFEDEDLYTMLEDLNCFEEKKLEQTMYGGVRVIGQIAVRFRHQHQGFKSGPGSKAGADREELGREDELSGVSRNQMSTELTHWVDSLSEIGRVDSAFWAMAYQAWVWAYSGLAQQTNSLNGRPPPWHLEDGDDGTPLERMA